jgi:hypothetical protein
LKVEIVGRKSKPALERRLSFWQAAGECLGDAEPIVRGRCFNDRRGLRQRVQCLFGLTLADQRRSKANASASSGALESAVR